ncbi:unnamed protein product [Dicrocoelium dendriticum]|nr:unnamed protein product [Dicrocoelium dendriticum]
MDISSCPSPSDSDKTGHDCRRQGVWRRFMNRLGLTSNSKEAPVKTSHRSLFSCGALRSRVSKRTAGVQDKLPRVHRKKNKRVPGHVVFDDSSKAEVWNDILQNSILGSGLVVKATLCNRATRKIYAYGPDDFTPSMEQLDVLLDMLHVSMLLSKLALLVQIFYIF